MVTDGIELRGMLCVHITGHLNLVFCELQIALCRHD